MFSELLSGAGPGNIVIVTETSERLAVLYSCLAGYISLFIKASGLFRPWFSVLIYVVCLPREKTNLNIPSFSMTQFATEILTPKIFLSSSFLIISVKGIWGPQRQKVKIPYLTCPLSSAPLFLHYEELDSQFNSTNCKLIQQTQYYLNAKYMQAIC